jgi:hypothetical protein
MIAAITRPLSPLTPAAEVVRSANNKLRHEEPCADTHRHDLVVGRTPRARHCHVKSA